MEKILINKEQARTYLVAYQGINQDRLSTRNDIESIVKKLGCIQYDPLNVVGRNADLVLQSRVNDYKTSILDELLYSDRVLIDGWDKMMSIYHVDDWANFKPVREAHSQEAISIMKYRGNLSALNILDEVRMVINKEGPVFSRELKIGGRMPSAWGHGKHSSVALDYLFHAGEIGVHHKKNAQKSFDIISNLLTEETLLQNPDYKSSDDFLAWYITRRIRSVGFLWSKSGGGWLGHFISKKVNRTKAIKSLIDKNILRIVMIEGIKDEFYIHKDDVDQLLNCHTNNSSSFIAPLDNLIWERTMTELIFDFEYRWEVYVPEIKRKYGYYVLPVVMGNKFIARFEADKYRGEDYLSILNWWWEEGIEITDDVKYSVKDSLKKFCLYLGAKDITEESYHTIFNKSEEL